MTLEVGDTAPDFALQNQFDQPVRLRDVAGWRLVWWLPTTAVGIAPPCSQQIARTFAEQETDRLTVLGLTFDDPKVLYEFSRSAGVLFPMLSATRAVGTQYGTYRGADDEWECFPRKRGFLVDPEGRIVKVYRNIDPDFFVPEVLADLDELVPKTQPGLFSRVLASLKS